MKGWAFALSLLWATAANANRVEDRIDHSILGVDRLPVLDAPAKRATAPSPTPTVRKLDFATKFGEFLEETVPTEEQLKSHSEIENKLDSLLFAQKEEDLAKKAKALSEEERAEILEILKKFQHEGTWALAEGEDDGSEAAKKYFEKLRGFNKLVHKAKEALEGKPKASPSPSPSPSPSASPSPAPGTKSPSASPSPSPSFNPSDLLGRLGRLLGIPEIPKASPTPSPTPYPREGEPGFVGPVRPDRVPVATPTPAPGGVFDFIFGRGPSKSASDGAITPPANPPTPPPTPPTSPPVNPPAANNPPGGTTPGVTAPLAPPTVAAAQPPPTVAAPQPPTRAPATPSTPPAPGPGANPFSPQGLGGNPPQAAASTPPVVNPPAVNPPPVAQPAQNPPPTVANPTQVAGTPPPASNPANPISENPPAGEMNPGGTVGANAGATGDPGASSRVTYDSTNQAQGAGGAAGAPTSPTNPSLASAGITGGLTGATGANGTTGTNGSPGTVGASGATDTTPIAADEPNPTTNRLPANFATPTTTPKVVAGSTVDQRVSSRGVPRLDAPDAVAALTSVRGGTNGGANAGGAYNGGGEYVARTPGNSETFDTSGGATVFTRQRPFADTPIARRVGDAVGDNALIVPTAAETSVSTPVVSHPVVRDSSEVGAELPAVLRPVSEPFAFNNDDMVVAPPPALKPATFTLARTTAPEGEAVVVATPTPAPRNVLEDMKQPAKAIVQSTPAPTAAPVALVSEEDDSIVSQENLNKLKAIFSGSGAPVTDSPLAPNDCTTKKGGSDMLNFMFRMASPCKPSTQQAAPTPQTVTQK